MAQSSQPGVRLARPIFVGGMSRSGTTVMGKGLLNKHPVISVTRPAEMWFLTNTGGLCDIVDSAESGRVSLRLRAMTLRRGHLSPQAAFRDRMQGFWYAREWWKDGRNIGLIKAVQRDQLAAALSRFESSLADDPREAGRWLAADLIDPTTRARGKSRWVDTTPDNSYRIDALYRLFPDLKLINMIRDGRDVAASVVSRGWGTSNHLRALREWGRRLAAGHRAMTSIPESVSLTIQLEELVGEHRERDYRRILDHLHIDDAPRMRRFFDTEMTPQASNSGRWRQDMTAAQASRIDREYRRIRLRLAAEGVQVPAVSD